jgi:hypothetical protein
MRRTKEVREPPPSVDSRRPDRPEQVHPRNPEAPRIQAAVARAELAAVRAARKAEARAVRKVAVRVAPKAAAKVDPRAAVKARRGVADRADPKAVAKAGPRAAVKARRRVADRADLKAVAKADPKAGVRPGLKEVAPRPDQAGHPAPKPDRDKPERALPTQIPRPTAKAPAAGGRDRSGCRSPSMARLHRSINEMANRVVNRVKVVERDAAMVRARALVLGRERSHRVAIAHLPRHPPPPER